MNIGIYLRLSKEDEFCSEESNSIVNQRYMLTDYVRDHFPDASLLEFVDDGYSGTSFERPGVQNLLDMVKNGEIDCIIVKDFSRFARDYIELGSYLEQIFPFMGVRFISVNDKYDSAEYAGSVADIDVNFKNLLNDLYSKDLSVKMKSAVRAIKQQGKFMATVPPFGYDKDPDDRHRLIVAEDEAETVRRIFHMYAGGISMGKIVTILNEERVKTPSQVFAEKGKRNYTPKGGLFLWQRSTVRSILMNRAYVGDLVQGQSEVKQVGGKKSKADREKWIICENTHEPIIDRETFELIQSEMGKHDGGVFKPKGENVMNGKIVCGRCKRKLFHVGGKYQYFMCAGVKTNALDGCVKRVDDFLLENMLMFYLQQHIMDLGEADRNLREEQECADEKTRRLKAECDALDREIAGAKARRLTEYEDYALGRAESFDSSNETVTRLQGRHEELLGELADVEDRARKLRAEKRHEEFAVTKLTKELMDEFIDRVEVYADDNIRVIWKQ